MKKWILVVVAVGALSAVALHLLRPATASSEPAVSLERAPDSASGVARSNKSAARMLKQKPNKPTDMGTSDHAMSSYPAEVSQNLILEIDILTSKDAGFERKQAAWKWLMASGRFDEAVHELEERRANEPGNAARAAVLGQAYLEKCSLIDDVREQAIFAMKADQQFDAALTADSTNWEARFTKAVALSFWPAQMNKGPEVLEHFQTLIRQQETLPSRPEFAGTYLQLGEHYEKTGAHDSAAVVWRRGTALFPDHAGLRTKLAQPQSKSSQ